VKDPDGEAILSLLNELVHLDGRQGKCQDQGWEEAR
jgi:hypothetical protein